MKNYGKSEFHITLKDGKPFLQHKYNGQICDEMKIYGINNKPYVKRLSTKMYLEDYMIEELRAVC